MKNVKFFFLFLSKNDMINNKNKGVGKMSSKRNKQEEKIESWVYVLLLSAMAIFTWVLGNFDFPFGKVTLTVAILFYPFLYFISNIITKKYGVKETMMAIAYSTLMLLLFAVGMMFLTGQEIDYIPLTGELFGYLMGQFINLAIYYYLYMNTLLNKFILFLNYVFVLLVHHFIAMIFASRMVLLNDFWRGLLAIVLIEAIIVIGLVFFDTKKIEPKVYKKLVKEEEESK